MTGDFSSYIFISLAIMSAAILIVRFIPFLVFGEKRKAPHIVEYLGRVLPYASMAMLVVYCLRETTFSVSSEWIPALAGVAAVVILQIRKRNSIVSVIAGTAVYMLLANLVFA